MKTGLKFQLSFLVIVLVCTALAVIGVLAFLHEKVTLEETQDMRGTLLVQTLASAGNDAILANNKPKLLSYCNSLVHNSDDILSALLIDIDSIIYAHSNPAQVGRICKNERILSALQSETLLINTFTLKNKSLTNYSAPLIVNDEIIGTACITLSGHYMQSRLLGLGIRLVPAAVLLICLSILMVIIIAQIIITKPLRRLSEGIDTAATGDFNRRVTVKSTNEIGTVIRDFNSMNESLNRQKELLFSLYNTAQSLDALGERETLITRSLAAIGDLIGPRQCILGLVENNNIVIKSTTGFDSPDSLHNEQLIFPNDIFIKTFKKQKARKFVTATLADTFSDLKIPVQTPGEEILISPLVHAKKSKGLIMLIGKKNETEFTESDRKFCDIISLATSMSLFNIELIEKSQKKKQTESESVIADLTRKVLMPRKPFKMKGIEVCSYYRPVGDTHGNWHGFIDDKDNNRLSVFIGDATGQGTQAALAASTASSFIKTMSMLKKQKDILALIMDKKTDFNFDQNELPLSMKPSYLLTLLNRILYSNVFGKQTMTLFASTFDLSKKKIYFANAGHEIPVLLKKKESLPAALTSSGARLGDSAEAHYDEHTLDLDAGDVIVWYSAGATRCLNRTNEQYGTMRFLSKIRELSSFSAQEICKKTVEDIHSFRKNKPLVDDISLVTGKIL